MEELSLSLHCDGVVYNDNSVIMSSSISFVSPWLVLALNQRLVVQRDQWSVQASAAGGEGWIH